MAFFVPFIPWIVGGIGGVAVGALANNALEEPVVINNQGTPINSGGSTSQTSGVLSSPIVQTAIALGVVYVVATNSGQIIDAVRRK